MKPGRVDEHHERDPEAVAGVDEERGLLRRGGVDDAAEAPRLVGDEADRAALDPRQGGDHVPRPVGAELEQAALVGERRGDVADVVDLARALGHGRAGSLRARPGARARSAAGRRSSTAAAPAARAPTATASAVVGGDQLADAVARVHARAAEVLHRDLLAERRLDDLRAGEEHPRRLGHDDEVGERGRVGAAAGGDAADDRDLRDALARARRWRGRCARSRRARRGPPAAGRRRTRRSRRPGRRTAPASSSTRTIESACAAPSEPPMKRGVLRVAEHRPAADPARRRRRRRRRAPARSPSRASARRCARREAARVAEQLEPLERDGRTGAGARGRRDRVLMPQMQRTALCPPKPNEFEIATRGSGPAPFARRSSARASPGHVVEVELGVALVPADGRRGDVAAQRSDRRDRLDRAGGAEQVADRRLRRARPGSRCAALARAPASAPRSRCGR